jgi:hypothetical protein
MESIENDEKKVVSFDTLIIAPERFEQPWEDGSKETLIAGVHLTLADMSGNEATNNLMWVGQFGAADKHIADNKPVHVQVGGTEVGLKVSLTEVVVAGSDMQLTAFADSLPAHA